jgi:hypothetical protein
MEITTNPDKYNPKDVSFDEFEQILSNCVWDWDFLEDESEEQNAALQTYIAVEEYMTALRRKFIEIDDDKQSLKKVTSTFNKFAPNRYNIQ